MMWDTWMTGLVVGISAIVYVVSVVLVVAVIVGDWNGSFPRSAAENYRENIGMGIAMGFCGGPFMLLLVWLMTGFAQHGLSLSRPGK